MTGDTEEASWMPESERKTWEDYLCPVYNKQLREQDVIASVPSRFNGYHKLPTTYYRTLKDKYKQEDHNIKVAIWVPKRPGESKCPVLVKFHGGGLIFGDCDEESTFPIHLLKLAQINHAIIIAPNHRLMPEANGHEINDDIDTFWNSWFKNGNLEKYLEDQECDIKIDFDRILLSGDSSGAIPVLHSWLTQSELSIRAIYLQYPLLHQYKREFKEENLNIRGVEIRVKDMEKHMALYENELERLRQLGKCPIRSASLPPEGALMNSYLPICDKWRDAYHCDSVAERIINDTRNEVPETFPVMCVYHGDDDERIPQEQNVDVFNRLMSKWGQIMKESLRITVVPGMMHGKDKDIEINSKEYLQYFGWAIEKEWGIPERVENARDFLARYFR